MKKTTGRMLAGLALVAASLCAISAVQPILANDLVVAQINREPPKLPEVTPGLDNPNNPSVPGNDEKAVRPDGANRPNTSPSGSTAEGRSRCGTLTDTLARRRCLEDLQRERNN
jgi:hypothetical protein